MNIYAFADEAGSGLDEQIEAMLKNGIDGLEIRNVDGVNIADISDSKAKEAKTKLDNAGLRVWSVGSPIGKTDIKDSDLPLQTERLKRTLELAELLGAENIRLFSFYIPEQGRADYKAEVIERLSVFSEIAEGSGITLCHENEKGIYGDIPEACLEIHKALPQIKAVFDPANFIQCGVDTLAAWRSLKPYVKYLHIKDALADGRIVPAGKGDGNLKLILKEFMNSGGGNVTLEPHLSVFNGLSQLERSGSESNVGAVYRYSSAKEAFAAGAAALKKLLEEITL